MHYFARGKVPTSSSEESSGKQHPPSRVTDYFFGLKQSFTPSPASSQRSKKSTRPAINRAPSNEAISNPSAVPRSNLHEHSSTKHKTGTTKAKFRWIKGDLIGKGSQGRVYMGLNVNTGEVMAVKQVELPQTASDRMKGEMKKIAEALREERETLKDLDHEHIVQYLGFEENEESLNIFLQYVSGGNIGTCLNQYGKFNEQVTKHFTSQILDGLVYLHDRGIIHRDLKSDNILVEESGVCKLSDFGISKKLVELKTRAYSMQGTSYWMAPEVFKAEGYDSKIDIWSVGCVVLEMWTARRPWDGFNLLPVWVKLITDGSAPPLPEDCHLSPAAEEFRRKCFQPDPQTRPTASDLLRDPYPQISDGWTFPGMSNMGVKVAMNPSKSRKVTNKRAAYDAEKEIMEVTNIFRGSTNLEFSMEGQSFSSPAERTNPNIRNGNPLLSHRASFHVDLPRGPSPPLVIIEPPGPRRQKPRRTSDWMEKQRSTSVASDSSESQKSSQSMSRPLRRLMIYNPDTDEGGHPEKKSTTPHIKPFVYEPPPLLPDDAKRATNHDRLLAPIRSQPYGPDRIPNVPNSIPSTPSTVANKHQSFGDSESSYSSSSIWQKPPAEFANSSRHRRFDNTTSHESSGIDTTHNLPKPVQGRPSNIGDTRPAIGVVLQRLETFFPNHNLNVHMHSSTQHTMKSVKAIAEENRGTPFTRQTRLWDSQVEEIKAPR